MNKKGRIDVALYILSVIILLYGIYIKNTLVYSVGGNGDFNKTELLLYIVSDPFIISYCLLPFIILLTLYQLTDYVSDNVRIRFLSLGQYIKFLQGRADVILLKVTAIFILCSILASKGLPGGIQWGAAAVSTDSIFKSLNIFRMYFDNTILACFVQIIMLAVTIKIIQAVFIFMLAKNIRYQFLMVLAFVFCIMHIFLFKFTGFLLWPFRGIIEGITPAAYLSGHYSMEMFSSPLKGLGIVLIVYTGIIFLRNNNISMFNIKKSIWSGWNKGLYILIIYAVFQYNFISYDLGSKQLGEGLYYFFYGVTNENRNIMDIVKYMIFYFGIIYFIILDFQEEFGGILYYKIIRYQGTDKYFYNWIKKIGKQLLCYVSFLLISGIFILLLEGGGQGEYINLQGITVFLKKSLYFGLGTWLQLVIYALLTFILIWKTKKMVVPFFGFLILSILLFPGINPYYIFPVGLNGLGHFNRGLSMNIILFSIAIFYITAIFMYIKHFTLKEEL